MKEENKEEKNLDELKEVTQNPFEFVDDEQEQEDSPNVKTDLDEDEVMDQLKDTFDGDDISNSSLKKLVRFTTGVKDLTDEELESLREDKDELARLMRIFLIKSKFFNYNPKKKFGKDYKQKRKAKNKRARIQRALNYKKAKMY